MWGHKKAARWNVPVMYGIVMKSSNSGNTSIVSVLIGCKLSSFVLSVLLILYDILSGGPDSLSVKNGHCFAWCSNHAGGTLRNS